MSLRPLRVLLLLALAAASAVVLAGCGNKLEVRTVGETEGIYIDVGELRYQVQLSRIINPNDMEDRHYLEGLPAGTAPPKPDEAWFGVWMRVQNSTTRSGSPPPRSSRSSTRRSTPSRRSSSRRTRSPTRRRSSPPNSVVPSPNSPAGEGVIQGSLILFKLTTEALANRPLELKIQSPALPDDVGIVDLDI